MARKSRLHRSNAFYHIMLRGNNGQAIFFSEQDKCRLCILMQQGIERFGHRIHAFCFMNNHVHLILQAGNAPISPAMQHLSFCYTRYINMKEQRIGHLFQGRFKAILIDDREYLLELIRYIHLNPVRSGIVLHPEEYRWSSHRAYMAIEELPWLTQDSILAKFKTAPRIELEKFVRNGIEKQSSVTHNFRRATHEGLFFGTDDFVERILKENHCGVASPHLFSLQDLIAIICSVIQCDPSVIQSPGKERSGVYARSIVAFFVKNAEHLTLQEFARFVRRDISALSKLAREIERKLTDNQAIVKTIEEIKQHLLSFQIAKSQT